MNALCNYSDYSVMASFEGNTNSKSASCKVHRMYFSFTFFYKDDGEIVLLEKTLKSVCKYFIFGKEVCPSSGKKHLQGFIKLVKKMRWTALKKLLPQSIHLEVSKSNEKDNVNYCMKDNDFIEWEKDIEFNYPISEVERTLIQGIVKSEERIHEIPTQGDNFMMNMYTAFDCGYFLITNLNSLRNLASKKQTLILLHLSPLLNVDDVFGIMGIIRRGHYQGAIFKNKYILMK